MNIKLDRREVRKVLIALTAVTEAEGTSSEFTVIRDKLRQQLKEWDEKNRRDKR